MTGPDTKRGKLRVLNLEDNPNDTELIQAELETVWNEVELLRVATRDAFVRALDEFVPDVVLSDFNLPDMSGKDALLIVRQSHPDIPVVMVTGALGDIEAVELVKLGARDYVMKDHLQRLVSAVQGALSVEQGIRARKAAEKALRQSEAEIRELVARSPVAMIVDIGTAEDERVLMLNRHFTELFGYTIDDLPDITRWWQLAYPDEQYRKEIRSEWTRRVGSAVKEHGAIEPMESTVICKDGSRRYVRVSFSSIGSRNIVTFENLTERRILEEALKEAADRNRAITETASDAIICIDPAGKVYLWNRKAEEMFGYAAAEALGRNLNELIMPRDYPEHEMAHSGRAMQYFAQTGGGPVVGTTRRLDARRKDGSEFPIELSVSAMNIHGEWHATGIIRDISRRVRDEARIARLNQLYEALSHCNQAIVRSTGEAELFAQICQSVVKFGGFRMAWIGMLDAATQRVVPVASAGEGAAEYLRNIQVSIDAASEFSHGPTGTAMREDRPFWCQDFLNSAHTAAWHGRAETSGWRSSASLPLHHEGAVVGAFNLYSDTLNAFEQDVRDLLIEMAADISYALDNFSHETRREQAEANLRLMARRAEAMLELPRAAESMSEVDFMQRGQELAEDLTGSLIGFIHFVSHDEESIELVAWSRRTLESYCTAGFDKHYPVSGAGIWADSLRRRAPVVFNDYENCPDKHGLPEGHAKLRRLVSVPVIESGKVVMLTGVGNKATDYTEIDVETVQLISEEIWRIVQQRRSGEALRQSEQNYRMLTEQVPAIIYRASLDKNSSTDFISSAVSKLGYSPEEWIANPALWESLIHPDDRENVFALLEQLRGGGGKFSAEYRLRDANGEWRCFQDEAQVVRDQEGRELYLQGVMLDITHRKQAEESLRKLSLAVEQSPSSIVITDLDANIEYVNEAFVKATGYSREEAIGENPRILHSGKNSRETYDDMWAHLTRGETWQGEIVNRRKDGSEYIESMLISPVRDADGRVTHYLAIKEDVTERKRIEAEMAEQYRHATAVNEQLRAANRQLEEAKHQLLQSEKMAAIGLLAAGVAHEINNPIGYVNSNLGTLDKYLADIFLVLDKYEEIEAVHDAGDPLLEELRQTRKNVDLNYLREDIRALIAESHQGLERIKKIILDLKNFSRSDVEEQWVWADLHHGLDSTLNVVWNELKYKCEVVKEYGQLPRIWCLPSQLNQVFMNLLVNAAQAIEVRGRITIRTGAEGDLVWVEVSDTGHGIPPEYLPRLFDPFFTTKPVGLGTGLGLSVSYKIVEKHRGKIEVHSEAGKGAAFRVWLPVRPTTVSDGTV